MFKSQTKSSDSSQNTSTIIGQNIRVEGDFVGEGDITVEGAVLGTLRTTKDIHIGPSAKLEADVTAHNLIISGEIRGNVKVYGKLELMGTGAVIGDIETHIISVETGATIKGKCATGVEESVPETLGEMDKNGERNKKKAALATAKT